MNSFVILPTTGVPVPVPGLGIIVFLVDNSGTFISGTLLEKASADERAEIIVRRLAPKKNPAISAVFGEPDFLPFPFLEIGIKRGAAVCRLVRQFRNEQSAEKLLRDIKNSEKNLNTQFSSEELAEILAIEEEERPSFVKKFKNSLKDFTQKELVNKSIPIATGFLVGRNYLLTNYHVFPEKFLENAEVTLDEDFVSEYIAQFSYEQDILGRKIEPISYRLEKVICFDKKLDYILARLETKPTNASDTNLGQAGDIFYWITMSDDPMLIAPPIQVDKDDHDITDELLQQKIRDIGIDIDIQTLKQRAKFGEPVNIIQHPKGRRKEIVLSNNWTTNLLKDAILYEADADFSSSGSPVFNQQWQLIALHHAVIGQEMKLNETNNFKTIAQKGIRISSIIEDMKKKNNEEVEQFIKEFVYTKTSSVGDNEQTQPPEQKVPYSESY